MSGLKSMLVTVALVLLAFPCCGTGWAAKTVPHRRGKVVVIRGAFTVFSLGLNELGEKLAKHGLDVDVIADISTDRATSDLIQQYQRKRDMGPIVFIGHSRGAELGPDAARALQDHKIPVKLIVMVDAVHPVTIPANVERCVNLYHKKSLTLIHGVSARAESPRTKMRNVDIDRLPTRDRGGSINHFNIDSSAWIHDLVIKEVLSVCPPVEAQPTPAVAKNSVPARRPASSSKTARRSTSAPAAEPASRVARRQSASGLQYPSHIAAELWKDAARGQASLTDRGTETKGRVPDRPPRSRTSARK